MKPHWILFGLAGVIILAAPSFRATTASLSRKRPPPAPASAPSKPADKPVAAEKKLDSSDAPWDAHQQDQPPQTSAVKEPAAEAPFAPAQTLAPPVIVEPRAMDLDIQPPAVSPSAIRSSAAIAAPRRASAPPISNTALSQVIEQVRSTKRLVEEQFGALQRDHEAVQRELAARKQQVAALEKRLSAMAQQMAERDRRLRELESLRDTLQSDLQASLDHVTELQKTVDDLQREKRNLPRQVSELKLRNEKLEEETRDLRTAKKEAGESQRQLERLAKDMGQKNRTIERLTHELETNRSEMQEVADQLSSIQRERGELEGQHAENLSAMESVQAQAEELTRQLDEADRQVESLQDALAQRDVQLKQSEAIIQVLQQKGGVPGYAPLTDGAQPATTSRAVSQQPKNHFEAYLRSRRQSSGSSLRTRKKSSWLN